MNSGTFMASMLDKKTSPIGALKMTRMHQFNAPLEYSYRSTRTFSVGRQTDSILIRTMRSIIFMPESAPIL